MSRKSKQRRMFRRAKHIAPTPENLEQLGIPAVIVTGEKVQKRKILHNPNRCASYVAAQLLRNTEKEAREQKSANEKSGRAKHIARLQANAEQRAIKAGAR